MKITRETKRRKGRGGPQVVDSTVHPSDQGVRGENFVVNGHRMTESLRRQKSLELFLLMLLLSVVNN